MVKKIKYVTESKTEKIEMDPKPGAQTSGMKAYEKVSDKQFDAKFLNDLCGGIGTTLMQVKVYNPETNELIFDFPMRVLSIMEEQEVCFEALDAYNKLEEHRRYPHILALYEARFRVRRSLTLDHMQDHPICGEETVKRMTEKQILSLDRKYKQLAEMMCPCLDLMDQKEVDELVAEVKKNSDLVLRLSVQQSSAVIYRFLEVFAQLQMDSSSIG